MIHTTECPYCGCPKLPKYRTCVQKPCQRQDAIARTRPIAPHPDSIRSTAASKARRFGSDGEQTNRDDFA